MAPGTVRQALVRYCLRPVLRSLIAYGSMHVATFWHPELGPAPWPPADPPDGPGPSGDRPPSRTSRARFQSEPEAWR
ncbi:hypothetical protein OHS71_08175 [Streptomyces sp. NBC_00377]|uniref:hypothetical protein n=1 Tax=unclassified Streptomyces TaxID=2593676 RepID=UPI002E1DE073|nr:MULTISPECIES: hypothetical protein [unclassified Streptomyces]